MELGSVYTSIAVFSDTLFRRTLAVVASELHSFCVFLFAVVMFYVNNVSRGLQY